MITIFHGDNTTESRNAYLQSISQVKESAVFRLDSKNIDINQINNFLSSGSLFEKNQTLAVDNFFSIAKATQDKLIQLISTSTIDLLIWQDKAITPVQQKIFPQAKINHFRLDNKIFSCLNSIQPHNLKQFVPLFEYIINSGSFDLFLYLLKANFRKQLQQSSKFDKNILKRVYLQIIELEFQYKTGQISLPREIGLVRVLTPLIK